MNLPNSISMSRILIAPVLVVIFLLNQYIPYAFLIVACLFVLGASTDFIDGMIARKKNLVTDLGKFLDPIADKLLVCTVLILMTSMAEYFMPSCAWYMIAATIIMIMRELIIGGFRQVAAAKGVVLAADKWGKLKTIFQDTAIPILLVVPYFTGITNKVFLYIGYAVMAIAVLLTIWSGISYIVKNKQVLKEQK